MTPAAHDPALYARSFADVYDDWYGDLDDPELLVAAFVERCSPKATVLELGGGTGRLATPLAAAGFRVLSLDVSPEMLAETEGDPSCIVSDMAAIAMKPASADACLIAYNTLFNLASHALQRQCLQEVARCLRPGGRLAIDTFIAPELDDDSHYGLTVKPHPTIPDGSLAIVTGPAADPDVIIGSHIEITPQATTCRPWKLAYQSPPQLDAAALEAGLILNERFADWHGTPFDPEGSRHISWYRRRS